MMVENNTIVDFCLLARRLFFENDNGCGTYNFISFYFHLFDNAGEWYILYGEKIKESWLRTLKYILINFHSD